MESPEPRPPRPPDDLEALARRAAANPDALAGLRAVTDLKSRLEGLERRQVIAALDDGASWARVADALGVSKQAAHRRHAAAVKAAAVTGAAPAAPDVASEPAPEPRILVTSEARRAVLHAREEARGLGCPLVGTEHLLLGILRCERSAAAEALAAVGLEAEGTRAALQPTVAGDRAPAVEAGAEGDGPGWRGLTSHTRRVLERSLHETVQRGEGYIGVEHLLLAVLRDEHGGAAETLRALGVERDDVRRALDAAL